MFTGIVREIGTLQAINKGGSSYQLDIKAERVVESAGKGDSIAVNGVCLTVVAFTATGFKADVMPETLRKSNLGDLSLGSQVNLEPSLGVNDLLDGHIVTGHIDGTGNLLKIKPEKNARVLSIDYPEELGKYIVEKGSIAVNGVSLTVVEVNDKVFKVSLIPESWSETTFYLSKIGDTINLETDILGKYIVNTTENYLKNSGGSNDKSGSLTKEKLQKYGYDL
ncbi:riboflavin synthase [Halanaerobiaceae bacterium Z-7014]|uniref:Riboflavin synthase n=1 Tax=Halonatronomonas betaini TaxID=2778430 RepID=A0A931ARJ4_9FIRM|nr:riboflavin synthase [Halonatronomonas betaini]MBF8436804.1 riboflavin synthase [Halonatronomonas betaini]